MAHKHPVYDTDKHFTIDPVTRKIINECGKLNLQQYDHDSERFTFEIPKEVDGHDMSKCNVVQIHYLNIEAANKSNKYAGIYEVDDLQTGTDDAADIVFGSWLISGNATQYVGILNFIIRFACVADDGKIEYAWNTAIHSTITIGEGINNSDAVATEYADVLELWRQELIDSGGVTDDRIEAAVEAYMEENPVEVGLTATGKTLLRTLLYAAVYDSDVLPNPAAIIEQFLTELAETAGSGGSGGSGDDSGGGSDDTEKQTFTVVYNLTGVVSTNTATSATEGNSFTTVLSAEYAIDTVTVVMGGVDITSTAYNSINGIITIAEVTGDIEITAAIADQTLIYSLKDASFNGSTIVDTGVSLFDESKDFTILFDVKNLSCANNGSAYLGLVEDDTVTDSYVHFCGRTVIANKNADTETVAFNLRVAGNVLLTAPAQASDANNRVYSAKLAVTFDSASNKWSGYLRNTATGETVEGTCTGAVTTIANTITIGGTNYRGETSFTCNEFSIYNRVLSADEISAWMQ